MHLVKSNFIRGNVLKKKYFQTPNLYIFIARVVTETTKVHTPRYNLTHDCDALNLDAKTLVKYDIL